MAVNAATVLDCSFSRSCNAEEASPPPPPDAPPQANEQQGGAAAVAEKPAPAKTPPKLDKLPPYRVLLHNDDTNDMFHVIRSIVELTPHNMLRARQIMLEAHTTGVAIVMVTHRERAELYRDQFRSKSLTVTIEPAE